MSPQVSTSPLLVWVAIAVAVLLTVATAVPKAIDPIMKAVDSWTARKRAVSVARDDADIEDLRRQIHNLEDAQKRTRAEFAAYRLAWDERERRWSAEWRHHREWDYRAQEALIGHIPPFDASPPFMSPDPVATPGGTDD